MSKKELKYKDLFIWPMGCELPIAAKLEKLWDNPEYIADTKMSGERMTLVIEDNHVVRLRTRSASTADPSKPIELTHKWPEICNNLDLSQIPDGTILDGEAWHPLMREEQVAGAFNYKNKDTVPAGMLFTIFDCPYWGGKSLEKEFWVDRRKYVDTAVSLINSPMLFASTYATEDIKAFYEDILADGGEGCVLKNIYGKYHQGKKPAGVWVKAKKKDTHDCVIIGYKDGEKQYAGQVGSIQLGQYRALPKVGGELTEYVLIPVGYAGGFTQEMRRTITDNKEALLGRVVVVDAYERVAGSMTLKQARFKHLRPEGSKDPRECIAE